MKLRAGVVTCASAFMLTVCGSTTVFSQAYPSKVIRFIVPHAAGGANDIIARVLAQKLSENLGQQVIVDNRAGGSAIIGSALVAKSDPDGYTILLANVPHVANPVLHSNLPYDTLKDFASITLIARMPSVLIVHPSLPVKSVGGLIALAKSKPGQINYASAGIGSSIYLTMALFIHRTGVEMFHVPYKSGAPALSDLIAGQVSAQFVTVPPVLPHIRSGRVRALGITSAGRFPLLPDTPTIAESDMPGFEDYFWQGVVAPRGTPPEIITKLNAEIRRALASPPVKERLTGMGTAIVGSSPEQLTEFIKAQIDRWRQVFKAGKRIE